MRKASEWRLTPVSPEALLSQQPFCVDTLTFSEWLQFVFLPRMIALCDSGGSLPVLPSGQGISVMAGEVYQDATASQGITELLSKIDQILSTED